LSFAKERRFLKFAFLNIEITNRLAIKSFLIAITFLGITREKLQPSPVLKTHEGFILFLIEQKAFCD